MIKIGVDGYSGSGKGELCKALAQKFNLKHLDTGAILRAIGLYFYSQGKTEISSELVSENFDKIDIKIEFDGDRQITKLCGRDVSSEIRQEVIGQMASKVAVIPLAMNKLIKISQDFASRYDCILDGRNINSEVLPDADVKFFLTASVECRAKRRYLDELKKNKDANFESVLESLKERDWRDTHRDYSPMIQSASTDIVDNTNMTISETVDHCAKIVEEKLKDKLKR